jgi:hypothetical protein
MVLKKGNIWEVSLLKGLGELLFIPEFHKITFKNGYVEFIIRDQQIIFEEVELNSSQINLEGAGAISFSGKLNFLLFPHFNPSIISTSEKLKRIITKFVGRTGLAVKIEGDFKNPSYKIRPHISSPLEHLKGILEGILY